MPLPGTASLKRLRTATWIILLGSIAGIKFLPTGQEGFRAILILVLVLDVIVLLLLWWLPIRRRLAAPLPTERSLIFVIVVASIWGMIAIVLGQPSISMILCVVGILYLLPRAIVARQDKALLKLRLSKAAITSVAGIAAMGMLVYGDSIASERADKLVVAVEQFRAKHGRYPVRLEEIVPEFISEIPQPNYVLIADKFRYFELDSRHSLQYFDMPPWSRRIYTFEDHKWVSLD